MKRLTAILIGVAASLAMTACNECSIVQDQGNPDRQFRLYDDQGNDLWFGSNPAYDPAAVVFEHETRGVLTSKVNTASKSVGVMIPLTGGGEEQISVYLDTTAAEALRYAALSYERKCEMEYELSYIYQNGVKICTICGSKEFEGDGFIYLKK